MSASLNWPNLVWLFMAMCVSLVAAAMAGIAVTIAILVTAHRRIIRRFEPSRKILAAAFRNKPLHEFTPEDKFFQFVAYVDNMALDLANAKIAMGILAALPVPRILLIPLLKHEAVHVHEFSVRANVLMDKECYEALSLMEQALTTRWKQPGFLKELRDSQKAYNRRLERYREYLKEIRNTVGAHRESNPAEYEAAFSRLDREKVGAASDATIEFCATASTICTSAIRRFNDSGIEDPDLCLDNLSKNTDART